MADALFREARELAKNKDYEQACPKFAESYRLDPAPGTLYNLAECEEKRGRIASALERWRSLVDLLTAGGKLTDARLPVARLHVTALAKRVPRLVLRLKEGAPKETVVLYDGTELRGASLDTELPIEPGMHTVLARAAYRHDGEYKLDIKPGERRELIVTPGDPDGTEPKAAPPASATPTTPLVATTPPVAATTTAAPAASDPGNTAAPTSLRKPVGLVIAGAGLASLVGAGVTGVMLTSRKDTIEQNCNATTKTCNQEGLDAARSTGTLVPLNLALWAVGLAGVGVGSYLFFSTPSGASAQVGASTSGLENSIWIRGRF